MNENSLIPVVILVVSLLCLPLYFSVKNYQKPNGILLFFLMVFTFFLRFLGLSDYSLTVYDKDTIVISFLVLLILALFFGAYTIAKGFIFPEKTRYFFKLLPLYLLFGAFQQIFFLWVVTDTIFILFGNNTFSFIVSVIMFLSVHLPWLKTEIKFFFPLLILFTVVNTFIYVYWGNIVPQLFIHGFIGTVLYVGYSNGNQLKKAGFE